MPIQLLEEPQRLKLDRAEKTKYNTETKNKNKAETSQVETSQAETSHAETSQAETSNAKTSQTKAEPADTKLLCPLKSEGWNWTSPEEEEA